MAFCLGLLLNGIGVAVMTLREVWQSMKYGFAVETDDLVRYSVLGAIGSVINVILSLML